MIAVRETEDAVIIEVDGEFTESVFDEIHRRVSTLLGRGKVRAILNLARARWTSLKILHGLAEDVKRFRQHEGDLKIAGPNPYLVNLLELTETSSVFDVYSSVDEAMSSYRPLALPSA